VMDQFTRRIVGFGVQRGVVDGAAVCRVQRSGSRANNAEVSQRRQRSRVSIPSVAGQPPRAGGDRNQDGALCTPIPSVCRAAHRNLAPRMPGPNVILDHDRPGGEASRLPALL
jgi:hypothetical protein